MKRILNIALTISCLLLTSCVQGKPDLQDIKNTSFSGQPFKEFLRLGYIELSENEWNQGDKADSAKYARKANILSQNLAPEMEVLYTRELSIKDLNDLLGAKYFLEAAFVNDIKKILPEAAAMAQVNFDCWVEIAEEGEEKYLESLCKEKFAKAREIIARKLDDIKEEKLQQQLFLERQEIKRIEQKFQSKLSKQRVELRKKYRKMPQPSYIFFDFNKINLDVTDQGILEKVARDIQLFAPRKVVISGNADNVGSYEYNMRLALKRASVVADYLRGKYGVSPGLIDIRAYGKNNPRKEHDKIKKDIRNRYVEIQFLKDDRIYYIEE